MSLAEVLKRVEKRSGISFSEMTEKEWLQLRVDSYNKSEGNLYELLNDYDCKICHNKGHIVHLVERNGKIEEVAFDCKCLETRRAIKQMRKSGLKDVIQDYTFDKYIATEEWQKKLKDAAMRFAENPGNFFFIGGQSGAGKTHLCTAICRKFLLDGKRVQYMMWRDDIAKLKASALDHDLLTSYMDKFKEADILYIDDLFKTGKGQDGTMKPTSADINYAFELINYRVNAKLPTIISSEWTEGELLDIDEATMSRIFEKSDGNTYSLAKDRSRNYRLRNAVTL